MRSTSLNCTRAAESECYRVAEVTDCNGAERIPTIHTAPSEGGDASVEAQPRAQSDRPVPADVAGNAHKRTYDLSLDAEEETELVSDDDAEFFASLDETSWMMLEGADDCKDAAPPQESAAVPPAFQKANGKRVSRPSEAAMQQAAKRLRLDDPDTSSPLARVRLEKVSEPRRFPDPAPFTPPAPMPPVASQPSPCTMSKSTQYGIFTQSGASPHAATDVASRQCTPARRPVRTPLSQKKTRLLSTPLARKSVSLGITPRTTSGSSNGTAVRTPFVTPFRDRAKAIPQKSPVTAAAEAVPAARVPSDATREPPVFRLECDAHRLSYEEVGIIPRRWTWDEARHHGVSLEACMVLNDPPCAAQYIFAGPDGKALGSSEACQQLSELGCVSVTQKWVRNHWALLLWKFAAQAAALPSQTHVYWSFKRMTEQLRYR